VPSQAEAIAEWLRIQSRWCARLDSPLYATLLDRAATDAEAGGPVFDVLLGHADDPRGSALALRFMGAVHRLVLTDAAPALAPFYPSVSGESAAGDPWPAFLDAVASNLSLLRDLVERPVQTNEVGRSATLLGGFLRIARETGMPMRVLEVGCSAGLNLRWDRFRYESGSWAWGDPTSPLRITNVFDGAAPDPAAVDVVERIGCDRSPIDPLTEDGRITLMSFMWPDQTQRFSYLQGALAVAAAHPAPVEQADSIEWLSTRLAGPVAGVVTVVYHSIVMQYLGEDGRHRLRELLAEAASRASADAPLAWLRFEPSRPDGGGRFEVRLVLWPGGEERLLAESHPHGPPVRWLG